MDINDVEICDVFVIGGDVYNLNHADSYSGSDDNFAAFQETATDMSDIDMHSVATLFGQGSEHDDVTAGTVSFLGMSNFVSDN